MNKPSLILRILLFFPICSAIAGSQDEDLLKRELGEYSGYRIWMYFCESGLEIKDVIKGIEDAENGIIPKTSDDRFREIYTQWEQQLWEEKRRENQKKTKIFFEKLRLNSTVAEVIPNTLYFEVMQKGNGEEFRADKGLFHMICRTFDDKTLLDTRASGKPVFQELDNAIEGFVQGIKGMKYGERRILYVHPSLAYDSFRLLGPHVGLILDVELLGDKQSNTEYGST